MSACVRCGQEFNGTPWTYRPEDGQRVHIDCSTSPQQWQHGQWHGDGPRPDTKAKRAPINEGWRKPFPLHYRGRCHICGNDMAIGTMAVRHPDGRNRFVYRHEVCP